MTPKSIQAIKNLREITEKQLKGRYELEVIDVSQQPTTLRDEDIIATPTLIKELPKPIKRLIGDLGDTEKVLVALNLSPTK